MFFQFVIWLSVRIGVVILNWKDSTATSSCLYSLLDALDYCKDRINISLDCVIVDNESSKESFAALTAKLPVNDNIYLETSTSNLGFGGGMNLGINQLNKLSNSYDYFWFLNNDCLLDRTSLYELCCFAKVNPDKLIIGPALIDDKSGLIQAMGGHYYNSWLGMDSAILSGHKFSIDLQYEMSVRPPDYIAGAAMFVSAAVSQPIFSSDYFLYFEELDLSFRIDNKERLGICPTSKVLHHGSHHGDRHNDIQFFTSYHAALSCFKFTRKHYPIKLPSVILTRLVGMAFRAMTKRRLLPLKAVVLALRDFLTSNKRYPK